MTEWIRAVGSAVSFRCVREHKPMTCTVSDFILHRLTEGGVRRIFGYPGDGINGFLGALDRAKESVDFIPLAAPLREILA